MKSALLRAVCMAEAATGLGLFVQPSTVVRLLLGSELLGASVFTSRIARHRPDRAGRGLLAG